jgi:diguanylate cyclase (GGDEF)-like protein
VHPPIDFRALTKDGGWRTIETVANNLLDDDDVVGIVLTTRDITDRRDLETRLAHQAFHDELTGLANRALFNDRVEHSLAVASRESRSVAVLFLDLDDFKEVNDSLGHQAGDRLLVETARRIELCLRQGDTAARLSGDEFGILLERATRESATSVAERVLEQLRLPITIAAKELFLRASVGIALSATDGNSAEELLRNADTAMYRAKSAGKSSFALFKQSMHAAALQRLELRSELEGAVARGELALRYQPVFSLTTGTVAGFEALLRWTHPRRGLVAPATFVPLAEETGAIVPIGAWAFETALHQLHAWETRWPEQARDLWISVNLSTRQLAEPSLAQTIESILDRSRVDPGRVMVEVTESVLVADADAAARRLAALRALGLRVAIDDFGTGYSSLGVLEQMPVDVLKIAARFVERLGTDERRPRLVEAMVRLGDTLDLPTVAEGIENVTQLTVLQLLGCEMGQGFFLSRPLRVDRVEGLLARAANGDPLIVGNPR